MILQGKIASKQFKIPKDYEDTIRILAEKQSY